MSGIIQRLERTGALAEDAVLVLLLTGMILLAATQIIGRNVFGSTLYLADELLRIMVLWLTLAGAVAASRTDRHISITLLDRFLPARAVAAVRVSTHLFTAVVCAIITRYCVEFVRMSHQFGDRLLVDVPAWTLQIILPIGFGLMAWRHALHAIRQLTIAVRGNPGQ